MRLTHLGRLDEAEPLLEKATEEARRSLGAPRSHHPDLDRPPCELLLGSESIRRRRTAVPIARQRLPDRTGAEASRDPGSA